MAEKTVATFLEQTVGRATRLIPISRYTMLHTSSPTISYGRHKPKRTSGMRELPLQSHIYVVVKFVLTARPHPPVGDTDNLSQTPNVRHHVTDVVLRQ